MEEIKEVIRVTGEALAGLNEAVNNLTTRIENLERQLYYAHQIISEKLDNINPERPDESKQFADEVLSHIDKSSWTDDDVTYMRDMIATKHRESVSSVWDKL